MYVSNSHTSIRHRYLKFACKYPHQTICECVCVYGPSAMLGAYILFTLYGCGVWCARPLTTYILCVFDICDVCDVCLIIAARRAETMPPYSDIIAATTASKFTAEMSLSPHKKAHTHNISAFIFHACRICALSLLVELEVCCKFLCHCREWSWWRSHLGFCWKSPQTIAERSGVI